MLKSVWNLIQKRERIRLIFLVLGVVFVSTWNIGGIASIMPLMEILTNPADSISNPVIAYLVEEVGFQLNDRTVIYAGLVVLALFVTGNVFLAIVTWRSLDFTRTVGYSLSVRLFDRYVWQEYPFYLNRNSSQIMKNLFGELTSIINGVLKPIVELLVEGIIAIGIIFLLFLMNPTVAFGAFLLLGGAYGLIYLVSRTILNRASHAKVKRNAEKFRVVSDALGAIKEIKLLGIETTYSSVFSRASKRLESAKLRIQIISKMPRYALETLAFGGILALALALFVSGDRGSVLPMMSAYILAGYKLMPALQKIFHAVAQMRGNRASVNLMIHELGLPLPEIAMIDEHQVITFERTIEVRDLSFRYPESVRDAVRNVSFAIHKNTTVGIAGPTGCGKTTLVDVLIGFLRHQSGDIFVDGTPIEEKNTRSWRRRFGYVPQSIYLSDTTIARNIAFGVVESEIDHDRIVFAAKLANLHEFVETLDDQYDTAIGERGVRISGGQRQRVGIARALYHDPDIIVFDEATSALDSHTEQAVMDAIANLMHMKTMVIIAHRLTTLKDADSIIVMNEGQIDAIGTYEQLVETHPHFEG
jgi:ABC-type multidrug transport system fused ATPase/permease subunit